MSLSDRLAVDLKEAMKGGDNRIISVLRMVLSAIHNREIEKRSRGGDRILTDEETIKVLTEELKKRKEAAELFKVGGRAELAKNEEAEQIIIQRYLPEPLSTTEIEKVVASIIATHPENRNFGFLMKEAMAALRGRGHVDGSTIAGFLKRKLAEL